MAVLTNGLYNCSCSREFCDWSCKTYATMMSDKVPNTAIGYVPPLKKTNADRIRAMTDEELATVIAWPYLASPPWCSRHRTCPYISEDPTPCDKCALQWLKQEASE